LEKVVQLFAGRSVKQAGDLTGAFMRLGIKTAVLAAAIGGCGLFPATGIGADVAGVSAVAVSPPAEVPVKKVVLFTSGVGYFEHDGSVDGSAFSQLKFDNSQINDVLKSLVLEDVGGDVSAVTYSSQDPLAKQLKSFGVDIAEDPSLDQLLNQLRGAKVTIELASERISGTILGVEKRTKPSGTNGTIDVPVINVVTDSGIRAVELPEAREVTLDDAVLQDELSKALAAVAMARNQDRKPLTIHFEGKGVRDVRMGYVIESPVWRTSYRLVLGDGDDAKLQGWAVVENQTDNDWNGVQLSLVSGRPISFIEDFYQPLYVTRPTVQPQGIAEVTPPIYPGAIQQEGMVMDSLERAQSAAVGGAMSQAAAAAPMLNPTESVAPVALGGEVGELFQYTIDNVSMPRQSSAMIPIVSDGVKVERLSIYNPAVLPRNPLNGARLKNTSGKHLRGGPITLFDGGSYAGDAQIEDTPPGQDRLISYGVDQEMLVDMTKPDGSDETVTGKIVQGVLEVTHEYQSTTVYEARNESDREKRLLIEQPIQNDWDLFDSPKPVEKTDQVYRFEKKVGAGKTEKITIKERHVEDQGFAILGGDVDAIVEFTHNGAIPQDVRDALAKAADMKRSISDVQQRLTNDQGKEQGIVNDQKRIDDTLRTVDRTTPIYSRLLQKLDDQETQLEKLRAEEDDLTQQAASQQKGLEDYLAGLSVG
jgi:hypothetical protein